MSCLVIPLILAVSCQVNKQQHAGFLDFERNCKSSLIREVPDSLFLRSLSVGKLVGTYSTDETSPTFALNLEEEEFTFFEHKMKAWHGMRTKLKNSGQWQYSDDHLTLKANKSQLILKIIEFQSNIWLVPTCQQDLFIEYVFKINANDCGDDLVRNSELLYNSFLHKKN